MSKERRIEPLEGIGDGCLVHMGHVQGESYSDNLSRTVLFRRGAVG